MAVGGLLISLPIRACWWLAYLAKRDGMSARAYASAVLLRHLEQHPGVDLGRSPNSEPKGGAHEQGSSEEKAGGGRGESSD